MTKFVSGGRHYNICQKCNDSGLVAKIVAKMQRLLAGIVAKIQQLLRKIHKKRKQFYDMLQVNPFW
jgi:fumarate hydratase class II